MSCNPGCCCCCTPIGGPSYTEEKCEKCGTEWTRYRRSSGDWRYKDCISCRVNDDQIKAMLDKESDNE